MTGPISSNMTNAYANKKTPQQLAQYYAGRIENVAYSHGLKPGGLNQRNDGLSRSELLAAYNAKGSNLLSGSEKALTYFLFNQKNFNSLSGSDGKLSLNELASAINAHQLLTVIRQMLNALKQNTGSAGNTGNTGSAGNTGATH